MGAFFLFHRGQNIDLEEVDSLFCKRGFAAPVKRRVAEWELWVFPKLLGGEPQSAGNERGTVAVVGTAIYRGRSVSETPARLLSALENGTFEPSEMVGAYCVFFVHGDEISLITDPFGIQNIYHTADGAVMSSSFLAVVAAQRGLLRWNGPALLELLSTGALVGPDTLVEGVLRLEPEGNQRWEKLTVVRPPQPEQVPLSDECRETFLERQLEVLDGLMGVLSATVQETGLESGITGGLDSRLLMALIRRRFRGASFHTHSRRVPSREFLVAEELCKKVGAPLKVVPVRHPMDMREGEVAETLERAFLFLDGHPRLHASFLEEYQTPWYRKAVLGPRRLCMSGIGGELFRNDERMLRPRWRARPWIRDRLVRWRFGRVLPNRVTEAEVVESLWRKISLRAGLANRPWLRRVDLKRFYAQVHAPSCLGVRQNSEGILAHFFSPFIEPSIASEAYGAAGFLGAGFGFELDMIRRLDPELATVPLDYGFSFENGEPLTNTIKTWILEATPRAVHRCRKAHLLAHNSGFMAQLLDRFEVVRSLRAFARSLALPLDWDQMEATHDGAQLMVSVAYLMSTLASKVSGIAGVGGGA